MERITFAENSVKTDKNRRGGLGKPFQKGHSGNPGGRPKQRKELVIRFQKFVDNEGFDILVDIACHGKNSEKIQAIELIMAYGYGKPVSRDKMQVEVDSRINLFDDETRAQILRTINDSDIEKLLHNQN